MNEDFIKKILELAAKGTTRSKITDIRHNYGLQTKDVGPHIKEAKARGMYSCPVPNLAGDTYYQYDGE